MVIILANLNVADDFLRVLKYVKLSEFYYIKTNKIVFNRFGYGKEGKRQSRGAAWETENGKPNH